MRHESSAQRVIEQPAGEVLDARQVEAACARKVAHECLVRCHVEENAPLKGQPFNGTRLSRSQTTRSSPFKGGMISLYEIMIIYFNDVYISEKLLTYIM